MGLPTTLIDWLTTHADSLDQSNEHADALLRQLAQVGVFRHGVPEALGGYGDGIQQAIDTIREIAHYSLTAAFISWGHHTLIQNLIATDNPAPRQLWLDDLLTGERAGGTGLSNAMKFLSGVEELQVSVYEENGKRFLKGRLPWVTNLRSDKFALIFAASVEGKAPMVLALPSEAKGLHLAHELSLVALQGSNTMAVDLDQIELNPDWIISENANAYLAQIRPAFLGLQCAMAFGLAERALDEVEKSLAYNSRNVLDSEWQKTKEKLTALEQQLATGLAQSDYFISHPKALFQIRIDIVDVVAQSLLLELQASGGRCYLQQNNSGFIRRWREGAFLPVVTPSAVQLRLALAA
ncbi:acyl-CoA dehydrogenase family protein [Conservatibacter flavescens]|uniref:Dehydrogenase n=1 Tax=Conservatibacter flavescens TaxID=28161 RepID=A0A2M8S0D7_9PAST|nr:acyl-CoA dehydrogenase family protein [Conservatibacter flavescens]PJG84576.1 dehydrogenase [Conservatibacter flavescens]